MKIEQTIGFLNIGNTVIYATSIDRNTLVAFDLDTKEIKKLDTGYIFDWKNNNDGTITFVSEYEIQLLNKRLEILKRFRFSKGNIFKFKQFLVFPIEITLESERTYYYILNEENGNICQLEHYKYAPYMLLTEKYIIPYNKVNVTDSILRCLTYEGKLVWERDFKEVGRFYQNFLNEGWQDGCIKDVQIFEELLIVSLYGYKVLALSIATGETVWEQKLHAESSYIMLDKSEGIVYAFGGSKYKINASTGEILFTKPASNWQEQPFLEWLTQPTVAADGIYAATHINKPAKIIKYSKETLDVLNVIDLDNEAIIPTNYSPTITDKYLMQLDGEDSLQIFELKDL